MASALVRARPWRRAAFAAALYALVVLGSAFVHHDADCHRKSPTHCTSCVFSNATAAIAIEAPAPPRLRPVLTPGVREVLLPTVSISIARFFGSDSSPPTL
jgi:hypothetical protein